MTIAILPALTVALTALYAWTVLRTPKGESVPMLFFFFCFAPIAWAWIAWLIFGG